MSWIVIRIADQAILGEFPSRHAAAQEAWLLSQTGDRHVAIRRIGPGWPMTQVRRAHASPAAQGGA